MGKLQPALSSWLDLFRWMAAFAVLITHTGNRLVMPPDELQRSAGLVDLGFRFATGFAHQGVMIFFVLSGFLVGGALLSRLDDSRRIDARGYALDRLTRLLVVIVPALALTALLDRLGLSLLNGPSAVYMADIEQRLTFGTAGCNFVFLQTVLCPAFGSNGPLWSLANEFWYYAAFPFLAVSFLPKAPAWAKASGLLVVILLMVMLSVPQFDGFSIGLYFPVWLMGVAASRVAIRGYPWWLAALVCAAIVVGTRLFLRQDTLTAPGIRLAVDLATGASFALLIAAMRGANRLPFPPLQEVWPRLAGFSFTLYVVHVPILNIIAALQTALAGTPSKLVDTDAVVWLQVAAALVVVPVIAYLISLVTEAQTPRLRNWIKVQWAARGCRTA